jgi:hypothetical protein
MTQPAVETAFVGQVPANLACGFCRRPIQTVFYRAASRFACSTCANKVQAIVDRNVITPNALLTGAVAGAATAAICAAAWAIITESTHFKLGIIAALIGFAVGKAVYFGSGKRRGLALQLLAAALSILGCVAGELALIGIEVNHVLLAKGVQLSPGQTVQTVWGALQKSPGAFFDPFDLLWIAIAVFAAWRLLKLPTISIAGPYPYDPPPTGDLQFQTVEPAQSAPTQPPSPTSSGPA